MAPHNNIPSPPRPLCRHLVPPDVVWGFRPKHVGLPQWRRYRAVRVAAAPGFVVIVTVDVALIWGEGHRVSPPVAISPPRSLDKVKLPHRVEGPSGVAPVCLLLVAYPGVCNDETWGVDAWVSAQPLRAAESTPRSTPHIHSRAPSTTLCPSFTTSHSPVAAFLTGPPDIRNLLM